MSHPSRNGSPGSMTAAMSAASAGSAPRVLRVGVIERTTVTEEKVFRQRVTVSAGNTERSAITVRAEGFPTHVELFPLVAGAYALRITDGMDGRVALPEGVCSLDACRALCKRDGARRDGDAWLLPLPESARGRVSLAGVTFLFQFVVAPPAAPRAQLPASLRHSFARSVDWRYNACVAGFMALAVGTLSWVEYGWDPVVDDDRDAIELVSRVVRMDPAVHEDEPEAPPDRPAAAAPQPPDPRSTADNSHPAHPEHGPRGPTATPRTEPPRPDRTDRTDRTDRALAAANAAVATAMRAMDAQFSPLVGANGPHGSAVDQLASNVLLAGTAEDLRNVQGITTRPQGIGQNLVAGRLAGAPGSNTLGHARTLATGTVGDGNVHAEGAPHGTLVCRLPTAPTTDTCEGDASAVARTVRGQLGGLRSCYERVSRNNPSLSGRVTLHFTVGESGRASAVRVEGLTPELDECLGGALQRLVFPVPACGSAGYEYPVTFEHGD